MVAIYYTNKVIANEKRLTKLVPLKHALPLPLLQGDKPSRGQAWRRGKGSCILRFTPFGILPLLAFSLHLLFVGKDKGRDRGWR
ncbi:MAG: hypothetical protein ABH870_08320 [bacterium]